MAIPLRHVLDRILTLPTSWRRYSLPQGRRIFHRDVQENDYHYANTPCLTSYYSVFVARLAIMVMLAILIGLLTILTWHFTKVYTTKSLNTLAYGLRYELLQRPILRMWNILNSTVEITTAQVKLSEYVIRKYDKPVTQADQVELYQVMKDVTWALFASRKALNAITINYRNGFVQAFHRDHRNNNTFYMYSDLVNYSISNAGSNNINLLSSHDTWSEQSIHGNISAIWYREPLDPVTGEKTGKAMPIPPDDLINIAGLSQVPNGVASWHVAVSKYTDSPLLSAALPVWNPSHESIVAVVGVTTALYSVGRLMKELVEFHSGHIYLTSQEGYLLATSTNGPLLINSTEGPKLKTAIDSEDQVIRLGAEWLHNSYGDNFPPNLEVHVENAKLGDQLYSIDSFYLNPKRLPIVGVIIIPRKYIMGKADERAFKTLIILISASLCILIVGCVCIFVLTNGVSKEMKLRAELISHLDARRRAEASSNYKSQFLANMSHELRTPMAAVIGLLDILICDDCLTTEQYATVTQIRKCSTALLRLLNNILDLSKVESGKLVLEEAEFNLERELEGLVDMFSVRCINHNVETILDLSDDIPKLVRGDSAKVLQIFANLISNSIKFTTSGHIILRGWCEKRSLNDGGKFSIGPKKSHSALKEKLKPHINHGKKICKKDKKMMLWFEVDDTGSGIDISKWESIFESFEQADPSTTRTHGGTGLGLCIVRTLVNKMGGEIKVVKKNGTGTLMQLYLCLSTPVDGIEQHCPVDFTKQNLVVLLALYGSMGRLVMSGWLRKKGVVTLEASEWNELTQILQEVFRGRNSVLNRNSYTHYSPSGPLNGEVLNTQDLRTACFIIVIDIGLLDFSTDIWKEQVNFLDKFCGKAKFAWMIHHDTSTAVKMELRAKGHVLMFNKPLYKAKMIHILETITKERYREFQMESSIVLGSTKKGDFHECLEIDPVHFNGASSDSDRSEVGCSNSTSTSTGPNKRESLMKKNCPSQFQKLGSSLVELTRVYSTESDSRADDSSQPRINSHDTEDAESNLICTQGTSLSIQPPCETSRWQEQQLDSPFPEQQEKTHSSKAVNEKKSLKGLRILLAEDTPVLQRVATIMLEKMGATVIAVGDGLQALDSLNYKFGIEDARRKSLLHKDSTLQTEITDSHPYDLILMDCQMPKMDGYEATKEIRKSEAGTDVHVPIVALTAHAMLSDEAKCKEVGMDAYLTKPIDYQLMVSTILSLTAQQTT